MSLLAQFRTAAPVVEAGQINLTNGKLILTEPMMFEAMTGGKNAKKSLFFEVAENVVLSQATLLRHEKEGNITIDRSPKVGNKVVAEIWVTMVGKNIPIITEDGKVGFGEPYVAKTAAELIAEGRKK